MNSGFAFLVSSVINGILLFGFAELLRAIREIAINTRGRVVRRENYPWVSVIAVVCTIAGALYIAVGVGSFIFR